VGKFNYGAMQKLATGLLTDFNQGTISLVVVTPGNGPPSNPGPSTRTPIAVKGVASSAFGKGASKTYSDGTLIQTGDLKVTTEVIDGIDPKLTDKIVIDGREYRIIHFNRVPDPGVIVAWIFFVRR